jgi:ribosomal protein S18 acetylase RimI-like enzyme
LNFAVRRAREDDVVAIAEVQIASWRAAYRGIIVDATLDGMDIAKHAIQWQRSFDQRAPIWVAEAEEAVVGFVGLRGNEITVLYVQPDRQRRGIGRALLESALATIASEGAGLAWLWVLEANATARAFYAAVGGRISDSGPVRVEGQTLTQVRYLWDLPRPRQARQP